jgi:hypothetical protein
MEFPENSYSVDDYITLNGRDRQSVNGNVLTWEIPQTYYSNRRSNVCTVECSTGVVTDNTGLGDVDIVVISWENGAQNSYSSSNAPPVLGIARQTVRGTTTTDESFSIIGTGQLLTQARPNRISLRVESARRASLGTVNNPSFSPTVQDGDCQFVITLKFKYYNQLKTASNLDDQFSITI